jgi:hypothetical protein
MPTLANTYRAVADVLDRVDLSDFYRLPEPVRDSVAAEATALGLDPTTYHASLAASEAAHARAAADHVDMYGESSPLPKHLR